MSNQKVIVRSPRKDVRRVSAHQWDVAWNTQQDYVLHTASEKETLMGFKIDVMVACMGALTGNFLNVTWGLMIKSAAGAITIPSVVSLDKSLQPDYIILKSEMIPDGTNAPVVYRYTIESKAKRKLAKGDTVIISAIAPTTEANANLNWNVLMYIGE